MKKLFVAALAAVAMVGAANAVNLRWKWDTTTGSTFKDAKGNALDTSKYTVYLYRGTGTKSPSVTFSNQVKIPEGFTFVESSQWDSANGYFGNMTAHESTFDSSNTAWLMVLVDSKITQDQLASGVECYAAYLTGASRVTGTLMAISNNNGGQLAWYGAGPEPTPEPTSGLLVLIGMGALALKRKRA